MAVATQIPFFYTIFHSDLVMHSGQYFNVVYQVFLAVFKHSPDQSRSVVIMVESYQIGVHGILLTLVV
jgi:hypothetical protein